MAIVRQFIGVELNDPPICSTPDLEPVFSLRDRVEDVESQYPDITYRMIKQDNRISVSSFR